MNEVIKQLYSRKSVRIYEDKPITNEIKETIINAAIQAPTAGNMMLYSILDITDPSMKESLAVTCDNQAFIAKAPMILIFLADYQRWYDAYTLGMGVENVRRPNEGDLMLACSDALIAAQNAVVAAEALGIGSCYIGDVIEQYERHKELLKLPDFTVPVGMLCFGYPTEEQRSRNKPRRFKAEYVVFENTYERQTEDRCSKMFEQWRTQNGGQYRGLTEEVKTVYNRKYNSDFAKEMTRSMRAYLKHWQ